MSKTLNDWRDEVGRWAHSRGWDFTTKEVPEKLCLVHSEISEALEEYRKPGFDVHAIYYTENPDKPGNEKPEGFGIELADTFIRLLHLCAKFGLDIDMMIDKKMAYNEKRPYRHGNRNA